MSKLKSKLFWLGILGAVKLLADSFGYTLITSDQVDSIANGLAAIFAIIGVYVSHDGGK